MSPTPSKDAPADQPAEETVDNRPPIAKFFDALGLKKGANFKAVLLDGGYELREVEVVQIVFCADPVQIVIVLTESGRSAKQFIQWSHIVALKV